MRPGGTGHLGGHSVSGEPGHALGRIPDLTGEADRAYDEPLAPSLPVEPPSGPAIVGSAIRIGPVIRGRAIEPELVWDVELGIEGPRATPDHVRPGGAGRLCGER